MAYINPSPGVSAKQVTLKLALGSASDFTTSLSVPGLQDVTVDAANDVFTWTQLDNTAKLQVATTSTNRISMNIVLDDATFFGSTINTTDSTTAVAVQGIQGLSRNKTLIKFSLKVLENSSADRYIQGQGYITGIAPKVSADQPVWVSPLTITVTGEYTISATE